MTTQDPREHRTAYRFFWWVTARPKTWALVGLLLIVVPGAFLTRLTKDTRSEAFIPPDHPSLLYREQVEEMFGLADPMVIAVVNDGPTGVFNPHSLGLVHSLSQSIIQVPGIDPDRITSLATENDIVGTEDGLLVEPFFEKAPATQAGADLVRRAVMDFDLYVGNLVSEDGTATLIVAELLPDADEQQVYRDLAAYIADVPVDGEVLHVAGEGAVRGFLGYYIDSDASRLNPLAGLVITLILVVAYRTVRGAVLPNLLVGGAVAIALGSMAGFGIPFYVITNGLPVILICIAVADGIHILAQYYEEYALTPDASQRELVTRSMVEMWRPVAITSLTDAAGFSALALSSFMPPMRAFGLFAALGSLGAMVMALVAIPAVLTLLKPQGSPAIRPSTTGQEGATLDWVGQGMGWLGGWVVRHPGAVVAAACVVVLAGVSGAYRLQVNESRIENFATDTALFQADRAINSRLNGTNYLDIVIETDAPEDLFRPEHLRRIEALQTYVEGFPHVEGSVSIVDYLKQMNRALNEDRRDAYVLPDNADLVAQYFLLYSTSGDPTDFQEEVDYDYRMANVRVTMNSGLYTDEKIVVEATDQYIRDTFNAPGIVAHLAGRVNVDYHWIKGIGESHFRGVGWALVAVCLMAMLTFRSVTAGVMAVAPVSMAILLIYAVMGFNGIYLGVGTSMFAAIAIGTGVDFAVHVIDRLIVLLRDEGRAPDEAFHILFHSTGRALFFNFACICLGFGVLTTSSVPPLIRFGALTGVAVIVSFLGGMFLIPALAILLRPRFLGFTNRAPVLAEASGVARSLLLALALGAGVLAAPAFAEEAALPEGRTIAERINARDEGESVSRRLLMRMTDRRGQTRERVTIGYRKYYGAEKRTVIFYESPRNIRNTGFLTYDYPDAGRDDDQWLYLPATRKVRRISASDRGDYFLGTDLTYEDIKLESRVSLEDYTYKTVGVEEIDGHRCYVMETTPVSDEVSRELGYGAGGRMWVDAEIWIVRQGFRTDVNGNPLKTVHSRDIRQVDGIWTTHRIEVENHKTGHSTVFEFSEIDYATGVDDDLFTERALKRGL